MVVSLTDMLIISLFTVYICLYVKVRVDLGTATAPCVHPLLGYTEDLLSAYGV